MAFWKSIKDAVTTSRVDDRFYEAAYDEFSSGVRRKALWARAIVQGDGDRTKSESVYLKLLIQRLRDEYYAEANREKLLELCTRLRDRALNYDQYKQLARAAGASLGTHTGLWSTQYVVTRGEDKVAFARLEALRPWFLQNVVPNVESDA